MAGLQFGLTIEWTNLFRCHKKLGHQRRAVFATVQTKVIYMESSLPARSRQLSSDLWGHSPMNDGTCLRDGKEVHEKPGHELSSSVPSTESAFQRSGPGILVFLRRQSLAHMNHRALELTGHFDQTEIGPATTTLLRLVSELRVQIQDTLDHRRKADIWGLFELKREIVESSRRILLRGFGLADRNSHDGSRIMIVLDEGGS